jgi:hypothetical protein
MKVKTNTGEICPREENYKEFVTDAAEGVEVPDTAYYRRLVVEGSLVAIETPVTVDKKASAKESN